MSLNLNSLFCENLVCHSVAVSSCCPSSLTDSLPSIHPVIVQAVTAALLSLKMVYPRRNLPAEQWRSAQLLSLLSAPAAMLDSACCDTVSHLEDAGQAVASKI